MATRAEIAMDSLILSGLIVTGVLWERRLQLANEIPQWADQERDADSLKECDGVKVMFIGDDRGRRGEEDALAIEDLEGQRQRLLYS